jgi:hypothetical protein
MTVEETGWFAAALVFTAMMIDFIRLITRPDGSEPEV